LVDDSLVNSSPIKRQKLSMLDGDMETIASDVLVAARISNSTEDTEQWILATTVKYFPHVQKYEVEDADPMCDSDPNTKRKHHLVKEIIPLPGSSDAGPDIPKGSNVLAMFPNTTSFYKAVVVKRKGGEYLLQFEDDDEDGETPTRPVDAEYVVARHSHIKKEKDKLKRKDQKLFQ